jgi:hypothetical protein
LKAKAAPEDAAGDGGLIEFLQHLLFHWVVQKMISRKGAKPQKCAIFAALRLCVSFSESVARRFYFKR